MPSNHFVLCRPLLLPSIFCSISGKQIEEGLGENQGAAVAGWMWETRVEAVVSGDSKMHGWVAGQIGGFIKMENRKEEELGQRSRARFRFHRVSTAGETALWKTQ